MKPVLNGILLLRCLSSWSCFCAIVLLYSTCQALFPIPPEQKRALHTLKLVPLSLGLPLGFASCLCKPRLPWIPFTEVWKTLSDAEVNLTQRSSNLGAQGWRKEPHRTQVLPDIWGALLSCHVTSVGSFGKLLLAGYLKANPRPPPIGLSACQDLRHLSSSEGVAAALQAGRQSDLLHGSKHLLRSSMTFLWPKVSFPSGCVMENMGNPESPGETGVSALRPGTLSSWFRGKPKVEPPCGFHVPRF